VENAARIRGDSRETSPEIGTLADTAPVIIGVADRVPKSALATDEESTSTAAQKSCHKSQKLGFGRENVSHRALPQNIVSQILGFGSNSDPKDFFFGQETCRYYLRPALALLAPILPRAHPAWLSPSVLPQWRCKAASLALLLAWRHRSQPRLREGEERASADLTMRTSLYAAQRVVSLGTQFTAPAQGKCSASVASGPSLLGALYDRPRPALRMGRAVPSIGDAGTFELEA
jgi:hypothetical protein